MFIKLLSILVVKRNDKITHFRDYRLHLQDIPDTRKLKQQLSSSKIELILESDIQNKIWYKLLVNLGINSITAIGHQPAKILQSAHT